MRCVTRSYAQSGVFLLMLLSRGGGGGRQHRYRAKIEFSNHHVVISFLGIKYVPTSSNSNKHHVPENFALNRVFCFCAYLRARHVRIIGVAGVSNNNNQFFNFMTPACGDDCDTEHFFFFSMT